MYFFFNDTATTEIYTLSLRDALPISPRRRAASRAAPRRPGRDRVEAEGDDGRRRRRDQGDRKSTRLNSSHANISYAVFCLKKKNYRDLPISYAFNDPDGPEPSRGHNA